MAKAIMTQIIESKIDTIHNGTEHTYNLPGYYAGLSKEILVDQELLLTYLKEKGVLLGILHSGFQNDIIACRAKGRPGDIKGMIQPLTPGKAAELQAKILKHTPNTLPNPDEVKTSKTATKAVDEVGRKMAIAFANAKTPWDVAASIMAGAGFKAAQFKDIYNRALLG